MILDDGVDLINYWNNIVHLTKVRKDIKFLRAYKQIFNNSYLQTHTHQGEAYLEVFFDEAIGVCTGVTRGEFKGFHNADVLVDFPLGSGQISWKIQRNTQILMI